MPTPEPDPHHGERRFDSPQQEAFLNLWRTYDRLRQIEDQLFSRHDLTAQQYNALRLLRAVRPAKAPTLYVASRLVSRAPDITRLLDKLHERGLVDRERPAGNRRVVNIGITKAGVDLLDKIAEEVLACAQIQLGHLESAEVKTLIDLLRKARQPHEPPGGEWG
ncbi:MAG TPA: MarR family transcriptional regulator [Tepidisphaeraceae bacterium]|jgi:DNA-binding MarR family transcriptional regulator|nr:MarR family transcriptional regulator [Tepidisphaeraceae bacterium]